MSNLDPCDVERIECIEKQLKKLEVSSDSQQARIDSLERENSNLKTAAFLIWMLLLIVGAAFVVGGK